LERKRAILLASIIIVCIGYLVLPLRVYRIDMSLHSAGLTTLEDTFIVPLFKTKLKIEMTIKLFGVLDITIIDATNNKTVFSWDETAVNEKTYYIEKTIDVSGNRKYIIIFNTLVLTDCDIEARLTAYTILF